MTETTSSDRAGFIKDALDSYEGRLVRYAFRITGNLESARDIVQETFLKLCSADGIPEVKLKAWLFTVTRNRALDEIRKESRMNPLAEVTLNTRQDMSPSPSARLEKEETKSQVQVALNCLPDNQKEIIRLKFQESLSYKEISEITGLTVSNVGVLIHTAVKKLREQLLAEL